MFRFQFFRIKTLKKIENQIPISISNGQVELSAWSDLRRRHSCRGVQVYELTCYTRVSVIYLHSVKTKGRGIDTICEGIFGYSRTSSWRNNKDRLQKFGKLWIVLSTNGITELEPVLVVLTKIPVFQQFGQQSPALSSLTSPISQGYMCPPMTI